MLSMFRAANDLHKASREIRQVKPSQKVVF